MTSTVKVRGGSSGPVLTGTPGNVLIVAADGQSVTTAPLESETEFDNGTHSGPVTIDFAAHGRFQVLTMSGDVALTLVPPSGAQTCLLVLLGPHQASYVTPVMFANGGGAPLLIGTDNVIALYWNGSVFRNVPSTNFAF